MEQTWCQCLNLKESESVQTERKKIMVESKEEDKSENLGEKISLRQLFGAFPVFHPRTHLCMLFFLSF